MDVELLDWGVADYGEGLARQRELFEELISRRDCAGWLILCEHPHVYTLGKSGKSENLLVSEQFLRSRGAELHRTERGGDITYHGPGQIVGYPILDLEAVGLGLRQYIEAVEQAVIETAAEFGIVAGRSGGKTGVWVKDADGLSGGATCQRAPFPSERKICAIGVRASRGVVMHGFALNVATDLGWFEMINPCGFAGGAVTSIEKETGRQVPVTEVKRILCEKLEKNMNINIKNYADRKTMGAPPTG